MGYPAKGTQMLERNVSNSQVNAANIVSCVNDVDTTLQLTGDGGVPFATRNLSIGKLQFDSAFNGGKGGIICDNIHPDSAFTTRTTFENTTAANTTAVFKMFLAFNKAVPGTGVLINDSPKTVKTDKEQTADHEFFGGGIGAIYPVCNPELTINVRVNGFLIKCLENP